MKTFKIFIDSNISKKRLDTCKKCDNYSLNFCKVCKCYMPLKTKLFTAKCPLEKWKESFFSEDW